MEGNMRKKKRIFICISSAGLYIYIFIRAIVKLLEKKKECYILFWYQSLGLGGSTK